MPNSTIAFWGTPELCLPILEALEAAGYTPSVIVTQPDRPIGRKQVFTPPPVKVWTQERGIAVLQPETLDEAFQSELATYNLDLSIVVAYGNIIPKTIIDTPTRGTINIHYSLLPTWRGAAPVEAAILAGDTKTGVTIQQMVPKLDAGPILTTAEYPLSGNETSASLREALTNLGAELLINSLPAILAGSIEATPQDESRTTHAPKIAKTDAEVSLDEPDEQLWRKYRAYHIWPRLYYFDEHNIRTIITDAEYKDGKFLIKKFLPAGGKEKEL